jgi:hypothetical protein
MHPLRAIVDLLYETDPEHEYDVTWLYFEEAERAEYHQRACKRFNEEYEPNKFARIEALFKRHHHQADYITRYKIIRKVIWHAETINYSTMSQDFIRFKPLINAYVELMRDHDYDPNISYESYEVKAK